MQLNALVKLKDLLQGRNNGTTTEGEDGIGAALPGDYFPADAYGEPDCNFSEYFFFKVVISDIGRIPRPKMAGQPKLAGVKTLVLHKLLQYDEPGGVCTVSVNAIGNAPGDTATPYTLHPAVLTAATLSKVSHWSPTSSGLTASLRFHYKERIPESQMAWLDEVIGNLLRYPSGCEHDVVAPPESLSGQIPALLKSLCELELVEGPPYKLTAKGKAAVEIGINLRNPKYVLAPFNENADSDINDATVAQLIMMMERDHWEHSDLSTSRSALG